MFTHPSYQKFWYEKVYPRKPFPVQTPVEKNKKVDQPENKTNKPSAFQEPSSVQNQSVQNVDTSKQLAEVVTSDSAFQKIVKDTIWVETQKMKVGISKVGARIVSLKMKDYKYGHRNPNDTITTRLIGSTIDLVPERSFGGSQLSVNNLSLDSNIFELTSPSASSSFKGATKIELTTNSPTGKVSKIYSFTENTYRIGLTVKGERISGQKVRLGWDAGIEESEWGSSMNNAPEKRKAHYYDGSSVQHIEANKKLTESQAGNIRWVGVSSKYFFIAMVHDSVDDADIQMTTFPTSIISVEKNKKKNEFKDFNFSLNYQKIASGNELNYWFFAGPTQLDELKKYEVRFQEILFPVLGWPSHILWSDQWFPPIAEFVLWLLLRIFAFVKDYGIAIFLLTLLSKIVTYPMTLSSMKSMNRMKLIQPKIAELRSKYKNNPKKMNEELMGIYKKEGVNPLNPGCLPIFLQMPIFIALFVVLRKAIELRGAGTFFIPWVHDLSQPEVLFDFGQWIPGGIPFYGSNFALMPIIMAVLTFFQNKMTIGKDPNQQMMIWFMPIFMLVLFNQFPSGLVLYWTLQSGLGLIQQYFTNKSEASRIAQQPVPAAQKKVSARSGKK